MGGIPAMLRGGIIGSTLLLALGCSNIDRKHGYVPADEALDRISVGLDTRLSVADALGRPSISGILSDSGWYYVESRFRAYGFRQRLEVDREVVAITFDGEGVVENIERFGLEDGQVVALSRRVTDSNIKGVSFLRQLFGNIGNFAADQFVN
ncbi:MAG: outer membrane protein assembly factor BamE [Rhodobacter sp.]|nr:outer membrane protein assembly factor BamE [Rhodobacter sp.]